MSSLLLVLSLALTLGIGPFFGNRLLQKLQHGFLGKRNGELLFETFSLDLFTGSVHAEGLSYHEQKPDRRDIQLTAEVVDFDLSLPSLTAKELLVENLKLQKPKLIYRKIGKGSGEPPPPPSKRSMTIQNLDVYDGFFVYSDETQQEPHPMNIGVETLHATDISEQTLASLCTRTNFSITLGKVPIQLESTADTATTGTCKLSTLALKDIGEFVSLPSGLSVLSANLSLSAALREKELVITLKVEVDAMTKWLLAKLAAPYLSSEAIETLQQTGSLAFSFAVPNQDTTVEEFKKEMKTAFINAAATVMKQE